MSTKLVAPRRACVRLSRKSLFQASRTRYGPSAARAVTTVLCSNGFSDGDPTFVLCFCSCTAIFGKCNAAASNKVAGRAANAIAAVPPSSPAR